MKKILVFQLVFFIILLKISKQSDLLEAKNDIQNLTLHIMCHTHNDVGWLKTVDECYYGSRIDI